MEGDTKPVMLNVFRAFQLKGERETAPPGFSRVEWDETRKTHL
jgi:hypothetical protein